jgi:hypothetical protein
VALQTAELFRKLSRALQTLIEVGEFHPDVKNFLAGIIYQPTVNDVSAIVFDECLLPRVLRVGARLRRSVFHSWGTSGTS